jgi:hypothetical protein
MFEGQRLNLHHSTPLAADSGSVGDQIVHADCDAAAGGRLNKGRPGSTVEPPFEGLVA